MYLKYPRSSHGVIYILLLLSFCFLQKLYSKGIHFNSYVIVLLKLYSSDLWDELFLLKTTRSRSVALYISIYVLCTDVILNCPARAKITAISISSGVYRTCITFLEPLFVPSTNKPVHGPRCLADSSSRECWYGISKAQLLTCNTCMFHVPVVVAQGAPSSSSVHFNASLVRIRRRISQSNVYK